MRVLIVYIFLISLSLPALANPCESVAFGPVRQAVDHWLHK